MRMCFLLQAIHVAVRFLKELESIDSNQLTKDIVEKVYSMVKTINQQVFMVEEKMVHCAIEMINYFTKNKLFIAQMDLFENESIQDFFNRMHNKSVEVKKLDRVLNPNGQLIIKEELQAMHMIMQKNYCYVYPRLISPGNIKAGVIVKAMKHLELFGLGRIPRPKS